MFLVDQVHRCMNHSRQTCANHCDHVFVEKHVYCTGACARNTWKFLFFFLAFIAFLLLHQARSLLLLKPQCLCSQRTATLHTHSCNIIPSIKKTIKGSQWYLHGRREQFSQFSFLNSKMMAETTRTANENVGTKRKKLSLRDHTWLCPKEGTIDFLINVNFCNVHATSTLHYTGSVQM